jgi:hypothetical protein
MGATGRRQAESPPGVSFLALFVISLIGGALGGLILLATPSDFFAKLVPWLVLFATAMFAWGSFFRKPAPPGVAVIPPYTEMAIQFAIAVYGGYFGGGIGFLMMASLAMAGLAVRAAGATKNVLAGVMNASAVAIFVFSHDVYWKQAIVSAIASSLGGYAGARMLSVVNEKALRIFVVVIGILLTAGLFWRAV